MEIVVNDTNILIDLYNAGLLHFCKQLNLEFRTLDVVMQEIGIDAQQTAIKQLVLDGTLKICTLTEKQVAKVFEKVAHYNGVCNLSAEDISIMVYAIDNNCRLLTGDKTLREKAILENVKVSGILFLTDMITKQNLTDPLSMKMALEKLLQSNNRLPKKMIRERIERLEKLI